MSTRPDARTPLLGARDVTVTFLGTVALDGVSITIHPGDVLAVVGANGSGKTTLLTTLCGLRRPDSGTVFVGDDDVSFARPQHAIDHGIHLVPQEPQHADTLSAWENLLLGTRPPHRLAPGRAEREAARQAIRRALPHVDPDAPAGTMRKADRAVLALVRALERQPSVLALDEPTAVLGEQSVEVVHGAIKQVCSRDGAVVLVSHRLRDVVQLASRIVVLADGRVVFDGRTEEVSLNDLVGHMASGRLADEDSTVTATGTPPPITDDALTIPPAESTLQITDLRSADGLVIDAVDATPGEILGICGLAGSGRSRLCRVLAGVTRHHGRVTYLGKDLPSSPAAARRAGIAYVPEDRMRTGIFAPLSVERNLEIGDIVVKGRLRRAVGSRPEHVWTRALLDRFQIKTASPRHTMATLSGGNQQRVLIARELASAPTLLIADEPTQAVDTHGRDEIHRYLKEFAAAGGMIVLVSSDFDELLALSSRILVMRDGAVVADCTPSETDHHRLVAVATGAA